MKKMSGAGTGAAKKLAGSPALLLTFLLFVFSNKFLKIRIKVKLIHVSLLASLAQNAL